MPYSGLLGPALTDDWTTRLGHQPRRGREYADPGMVAQPGADPGYGMPNAYVGNLNQAPGIATQGWLPASQDEQLLRALQALGARI